MGGPAGARPGGPNDPSTPANKIRAEKSHGVQSTGCIAAPPSVRDRHWGVLAAKTKDLWANWTVISREDLRTIPDPVLPQHSGRPVVHPAADPLGPRRTGRKRLPFCGSSKIYWVTVLCHLPALMRVADVHTHAWAATGSRH